MCTLTFLESDIEAYLNRRLINIKQVANTTQINFTKGLKLPSAKGMSIGDESAEERNSNNQTQEVAEIPEVTSSNRDALNQTVNKSKW